MYICDFSRSVGAGSATTRKTRGLTRSVMRLIVPPLPAASRPSKTTQILAPVAFTHVLELDQLHLQRLQLALEFLGRHRGLRRIRDSPVVGRCHMCSVLPLSSPSCLSSCPSASSRLPYHSPRILVRRMAPHFLVCDSGFDAAEAALRWRSSSLESGR